MTEMSTFLKKQKILYRSTGLNDEMLIENRTKESKDEMKLKFIEELENLVVQALDRLVSLSCIHYCTSTCDLSTS